MVLLVVDMQKGIMNDALYDYDGFSARVVRLIAASRARGHEVIFFQHDDGPGSGFSYGDYDFELAEVISPLAGEKVFVKDRSSCFTNPQFVGYMEKQADKRLLVVGLQTNYCIDATVQAAADRGYEVFAPRGCNSTFDNDYMNAETTVRYYNQEIWPKRFARCIAFEEAMNLLEGE